MTATETTALNAAALLSKLIVARERLVAREGYSSPALAEFDTLFPSALTEARRRAR